MNAKETAKKIKKTLPKKPTEVNVFDALVDKCDYDGMDKGKFLDAVMSELVNMGIDIHESTEEKLRKIIREEILELLDEQFLKKKQFQIKG